MVTSMRCEKRGLHNRLTAYLYINELYWVICLHTSYSLSIACLCRWSKSSSVHVQIQDRYTSKMKYLAKG